MQKTISQTAKFIKALMPSDSLEGYELKPMLKNITSEKNIQSGVFAFKKFLSKLYDRLIADGSLYEKPFKKTKNDDSQHDDVASLAIACPFINDVTSVLCNIGYYGSLNESGDLIILDNCQSLSSLAGSQGGHVKQKISASKVMTVFRLLSLCGINFAVIDFGANITDLAKLNLSQISYPDDPIMLTGLKVMAIAHNELGTKNYYYIFQRCDYRVLKNEPMDITTLLKGYFSLLPNKVQEFIFRLHIKHLDAGLVCKMKMHYFGVIFTYSYKNNVIWDFMPSPDGCYIFTKANNLDRYIDDVGKFHILLQNKISRGYGCDKKKFGEPCQKGCHGYSFFLDDSVLEISRDIETWLDKELSCQKKK